MNHVAAVLSMLHEPADRHSAARLFRGDPVLRWTLERLSQAKRVGSMTVICWEDQLPLVTPAAADGSAVVLDKGPRARIDALQTVAAARRWADGWRGGLLGTCHFDLGFYAPFVQEIKEHLDADALLLIDPAAALVDPALVDRLIEHAEAHPQAELCFSQAAPGLSGVVLRASLLEKLSAAKLHPGAMLHYDPRRPSRDPITCDSCVTVPTSVARTLHRFTLDSHRQIARVARATVSLNGELITTQAEELVHRISSAGLVDDVPRDVCLELTQRRATKPIFRPGRYVELSRPDFTLDLAKTLFEELASAGDVRLTFAGAGDPLCAANFFDVIDAARAQGIEAIHVETDLLDITPEAIARLAESNVDIVSVHVPAMSAQTYEAVMGCAGLHRVVENIRLLAERRRGLPLIVPLFAKCPQNLAEMELWYDRWLVAAGSAVIFGPSDFAGQIPDTSVADMSPPRRTPCARIASRLTVLSDGTIVSCEQDVLGRQPMGHVARDSIRDVWRRQFGELRACHALQQWDDRPLCARCREWHRP